MTINQLHKLTTKAVAEGWGRRKVLIDKATFRHALEDEGCVLLEAETALVESFPLIDCDGFLECDSRGSHKERVGMILRGDHNPREFEEP